MTAVVAFALALSVAAADQNPVTAARDLYASAAYEDALVVLDRASTPDGSADARSIAQYKALCLLALGRKAEADRAIEAVVAGEPMFRPTASDASPRIRAAFAEVRRRMLPTIIQQRYASAKAAFDRKDYGVAASEFAAVLEVMDDADAAQAVAQPPLSDLHTLAAGFQELARNAAPPPPIAATPVVLSLPAPAPPPAPRVYSGGDPGVVPPLTMHQELPPFPGEILVRKQGTLEIVIDENGAVAGAMMRQSITPQYDQLALAAARTWKYRPATVDGAAVKFRKVVQISLKPRTSDR